MLKNKEEMKVWYAGAQAFNEGKPEESNPYFGVDTKEADALSVDWQDGWFAASDAREAEAKKSLDGK